MLLGVEACVGAALRESVTIEVGLRHGEHLATDAAVDEEREGEVLVGELVAPAHGPLGVHVAQELLHGLVRLALHLHSALGVEDIPAGLDGIAVCVDAVLSVAAEVGGVHVAHGSSFLI